jgi:hypothetical protein
MQEPICSGGTWTLSACNDPDMCKDGDTQAKGTCGPNASGQSVDHCVSGAWQNQCEGADACTNGDTRVGTDTCGYSGHLQQQCQGGQWADTFVCNDPSPDDTQLLADEAAQKLSFQCFAPALTQDQMIQHFPDGSPQWTPDSQTRASLATTTLVNYTRTCNQLTGCGQWTYIVGLGQKFNIGYLLDTSGNLYLFQAISQLPGMGQLVLPVTDGMTTATLSTDDLNFMGPQRFLVKVTDTCFSLSTLVKKGTPDANGQWVESVWGALEQWTWPADPHPVAAPVPTIANDTCPPAATTIQAIAAAWIGAGQSQKYLASDFWTLSQDRHCTPYTSCDPWVTNSDFNDAILKVVGTGLQITVNGQTFTLQADGTFGNMTMYGHLTPTCAHLWHHETTPNAGGLAGGAEVAEEWIIQHP